eukprot:2612972-Pyramimonas_sp.AAC.1
MACSRGRTDFGVRKNWATYPKQDTARLSYIAAAIEEGAPAREIWPARGDHFATGASQEDGTAEGPRKIPRYKSLGTT